MLKLVIDTIMSPALLVAFILAGIATAFAVWTSGDSSGVLVMYATSVFASLAFSVIIRAINRGERCTCG